MATRVLLLLLLFLALDNVQLEKTAAPNLSHYKVDKDKISISGFSSGAYFSVQFHVSFSETIMGAGIVAGGTIDALHNLKNAKVFLFSGTLDTVVHPGVVKKTEEYYRYFVSSDNIATKYTVHAEHAIVTDDYGNVCSNLVSPFINNCNYPTATHIFQHIYPDLKSAPSIYAKTENLMEYNQAEFFKSNPTLASMDFIGYIYVPTACKNENKTCRLHLAFHGCEQGRKYVSTAFALHAGYNSVAEMNDIIVLYPQAEHTTVDPHGCWDWWGFTGRDYACKYGAQIAGVKLMLNRVAGLP